MNRSLFPKELLKCMQKTGDKHQEYTDSNYKLKQMFKETFNKKTMECIAGFIRDNGYDEEIKNVQNFLEQVNAGNYDENDIYIFKATIDPYLDQIYARLKDAGDFKDEC